MNSSLVYTMGTALDRASELGTLVQVLVHGQWLAGRVAAVDGHGVVLERDEIDHVVVRLADVSAVKVVGNVPGIVMDAPRLEDPRLRDTSLAPVPRPRAYA